MVKEPTEIDFKELEKSLGGKLKLDHLSKMIYSTDASVYMEKPVAIALPESEEDLVALVGFANKSGVALIPRGAGTSLAGQVVGKGMVIDFSIMNKILNFDQDKKEVTVQPGVVRDELNTYLKPYKLFFSPITSTANRAMIGGMVGNNSCGTNSIKYGSTRDKIVSVKTVLYDGEVAILQEEFPGMITNEGFQRTYDLIKNKTIDLLIPEKTKNLIKDKYPNSDVTRRNTGYALDYLSNCQPFNENGPGFNLAKLIAGSEGTLALFSEITLKLDSLPPPHGVVVAVHFDQLMDSFLGTQVAMKHKPYACEMMDKIILDCTKENIQQKENRFFIQGDPEGLLMVEYRDDSIQQCDDWADELIADFGDSKLGYAFSRVYDADITKVWSLRSSGLGVLANIPGDEKAVACIEDTAVSVQNLPQYMEELQTLMASFGQKAVYYAHAGAGEIHLRPLLNLKTKKGIADFYKISKATAELVKKYGGSLSGEHGDGRVRSPFIPLVLGEEIYQLLEKVKDIWDPNNIFNPGKIVRAGRMDVDLRTFDGQTTPAMDTMYDFSKSGGFLRLAEKCNGSGDCRKLPLSGGTMCPSYHATRDEKDTTRARANTLRSLLVENGSDGLHAEELSDVLELCLSCKACSSECPSNVNMTLLKSEVLYQKGKKSGFPLRSKIFGNFGRLFKFGSKTPAFANLVLSIQPVEWIIKKVFGIAGRRSLPKIASKSLYQWYIESYSPNAENKNSLYLFVDEFTNYLEPIIGIKAIKLLHSLGYNVLVIDHPESGRAAMSKGLLSYARKVAEENVKIFSPLINTEIPLVGIEPSAILSFVDEYPILVSEDLKMIAQNLSENVFLIEDFLCQELEKGKFNEGLFDEKAKKIIYHGHCHQKSLSKKESATMVLSLPKNHDVHKLNTGCCGMAGSFGYEKEHFEISKKIANLSLIPSVQAADKNTIIAASGTSCRHQIFDLTGKYALHPAEVLYDSLRNRSLGSFE
jgi:FAD/FMN-containing dehydrogenase/Fe-S oxidoreductase